jgi:O-antigen ligase
MFFSINNQETMSVFFLTMQAVWIGYLLTIWLYNSREYKYILIINAISIIPFLIRSYFYYSSFAWGTRRYSFLFGINTNSWGIRLAFSIAFAILNIYYTKQKKLKVVFAIIVVASFIVILITGSRRSLLLSLLSFCILLLGHNPSQIKKLKVVFIIISVLLIVYRLVMVVPQFYAIVGSRIDEALASFYSEGTVLDNSRNEMIEVGLELFWERPLTGWGLGTFEEASGLGHPYCHNNYVELLFASGVIGFITYYSLLVSIIVRGIKQRDNGKQFSVMVVLMRFILISGYVTVDYTSLFNHLIISITLSISYLTSENYDTVLINFEQSEKGLS